MSERALGVGMVGAGNIAGAYARDIDRDAALDLVGVTDLDRERALSLAGEHGVPAYRSLDALLGNDGVEIVVNVTAPAAHAEVTRRCLLAGRCAASGP